MTNAKEKGSEESKTHKPKQESKQNEWKKVASLNGAVKAFKDTTLNGAAKAFKDTTKEKRRRSKSYGTIVHIRARKGSLLERRTSVLEKIQQEVDEKEKISEIIENVSETKDDPSLETKVTTEEKPSKPVKSKTKKPVKLQQVRYLYIFLKLKRSLVLFLLLGHVSSFLATLFTIRSFGNSFF